MKVKVLCPGRSAKEIVVDTGTTVEQAITELDQEKLPHLIELKYEAVADSVDEFGSHTLTWDGSSVASGIYILRLESGNATMSRKVALVR